MNTVEVVDAMISGIFSEATDPGYPDNNPAYGLLKKILPPRNKRKITGPDPFNNPRPGIGSWRRHGPNCPLVWGETLAMCWENLDVRNL